MNLRQVEIFRQVFETRSVTGAAVALGISQPAVSKHLGALERACGFLLFSRTAGRLVPTTEGRLFALEIDRLFQNIGRLEHIARSIAERRRGSIRIAAFPALSNRFLPATLAPILRDRPDVRLTLESRTSPRIVEMAINQGIDVGFSLLPVEHPLVECTCVCDFDLVCVLPDRHPLTAKTSLCPADLSEEPFISLGAADRSRTVTEQAFGVKHPRSRMQIEAQMAEAACSFVANGLGIAIVPPFVAQAFARDGLVTRPFLPAVEMQIWQHVPLGNPVGELTRELANGIRQALRPYAHPTRAGEGPETPGLSTFKTAR